MALESAYFHARLVLPRFPFKFFFLKFFVPFICRFESSSSINYCLVNIMPHYLLQREKYVK